METDATSGKPHRTQGLTLIGFEERSALSAVQPPTDLRDYFLGARGDVDDQRFVGRWCFECSELAFEQHGLHEMAAARTQSLIDDILCASKEYKTRVRIHAQ